MLALSEPMNFTFCMFTSQFASPPGLLAPFMAKDGSLRFLPRSFHAKPKFRGKVQPRLAALPSVKSPRKATYRSPEVARRMQHASSGRLWSRTVGSRNLTKAILELFAGSARLSGARAQLNLYLAVHFDVQLGCHFNITDKRVQRVVLAWIRDKP